MCSSIVASLAHVADVGVLRREELDTLRTRLVEIREKLADLLTNRYKVLQASTLNDSNLTIEQTPGNWEIITQGGGLFT